MKSQSWPLGFSASGISAGLSHKKNKKDLALFVSHLPAQGAALFTNSQVKAAPIFLTHERLLKSKGQPRAILVNAGSANAATGHEGYKDAVQTTKWVADGFGFTKEQVWTASTGVIGTRLNLKRFKKGVLKLVQSTKILNKNEGHLAAEAILTTDTHSKIADLTFKLADVPVRIWGCAKGSGMIHPDLRGPRGKLHATLLSFILTDAAVVYPVLQRALEKVANKTFNCVSVDGDTSTNDFVGLMANEASGMPLLSKPQGKNYKIFCSALYEICERLTTMIALDGEGASKMIHIFVEGARSEKSARQMAAVVASSPLVKTACHGADPNWGRILAAMGRSGVRFIPSKVKIWMGDFLVCQRGQEMPFSEKKVIQYLKNKRILIRIHLGLGNRWARYKTCDFTGHYVGINAGYRT